MRRADRTDVPFLLDLMDEFYVEGGYRLNRTRAATAFTAILADARWGFVWIIDSSGEDVGYVVLTIRYAMEYGGAIACLDDLYVKPAWRNRGLSTAALVHIREFCERTNIRALTVEVGPDNGSAQTVYRRAGFSEAGNRQLLSLALAAPTHDV